MRALDAGRASLDRGLGRFARLKQARLARLEDLKRLGGDMVPLARRRQLDERIVDALIGQLEAAEVGTDREPRPEIQVRADSLFGIHVLRGHEPAWLVRADGQQRDGRGSKAPLDVAEVPGIAGVSSE